MSSAIVHSPQNRTSFTQSTVNFRCTSDQLTDIYWKYKEVRGDADLSIFDHFGKNEKMFGTRFVKRVNGSTSVLSIHDVQKSDTGIYSCREKYAGSVQSAQLVVIGQ